MKVIDGQTEKLVQHLTPDVRKVLIRFFHGVGDVVMFLAPLAYLRKTFPHIRFDLGVADGLDEEKIVPDAIVLDDDWLHQVDGKYDIVFMCHFPMESMGNPHETKAEVCCRLELGIPPIAGHLPISPKPLVAVHLQNTSVPGLANPDAATAEMVWRDVEQAGCVPIEVHFEHVFHYPKNTKYDFVDLHVRACHPQLDHLVSLIGASFAFVGVPSGPFHLAMSILPPTHVMMLERTIKTGHLTKLPIATGNAEQYNGEVRPWLESLMGVA